MGDEGFFGGGAQERDGRGGPAASAGRPSREKQVEARASQRHKEADAEHARGTSGVGCAAGARLRAVSSVDVQPVAAGRGARRRKRKRPDSTASPAFDITEASMAIYRDFVADLRIRRVENGSGKM